jgi:RsiW-degrading membrane proteinase PrsW (M82 family)
VTLLLTLALCALLRARAAAALATAIVTPDATISTAFLDAAARVLTPHGPLARAGEIVVMVLIEETIKLLPIFLLVRRRAIGRATDAMFAAAIAGLCFGTIEAINHSFFFYAPGGLPLTTYVIRALVMAPSHGIGAALACGVMFARAARRGRFPARTDALAGFAVAVALHIAHNGGQALLGPVMQIPSVFLPVALLYVLANRATQDEARHEGHGGQDEAHQVALPFFLAAA